MEKQVDFFIKLITLLLDNLETILSIAAFIISVISITITIKDRENKFKVILMKTAEFYDYITNQKNNVKYSSVAFAVLVRNTGRTNIYIRRVWIEINGVKLNVHDPEGFTESNMRGIITEKGLDPGRVFEPYSERMYLVYNHEITNHPSLSAADLYKVKAFALIQSGHRGNSGNVRHIYHMSVF